MFALEVSQLSLPMLICDRAGQVVEASRGAMEILQSFSIETETSSLPATLRFHLTEAPVGEAVQWSPGGDSGRVLGLTRYALDDERSLAVIREISSQQRTLTQRLHYQRLAAIGQIVAAVAHDARNVLGSIVYNTSTLADECAERPSDPFAQESREILDEIEVAGKRLSDLIQSLLSYAKPGPPTTIRVSLHDSVMKVLAMLRPSMRVRRCFVDTDFTPETKWIQGNPLLIEQILLNLLHNSMEASEEPVRVSVTSSRTASMVQLRIEDDGPGIADHVRPLIFEPFVTTKAGAAGTGLPLAREAARSLGGDLVLETRRSPGAVFVVTLPAWSGPAGVMAE